MATMNSISINYTDTELRNLVEEFITQQKTDFTLKGVCSYILYWAVEDGKNSKKDSLIESDELQQGDQDKVKHILETIILDGRITVTANDYYSKR